MINVSLANNINIYSGQSEKTAVKIAKMYVNHGNYNPMITKIEGSTKSELLHWTQQPTWYKII
jgi:hypothetical protein